MITGFPDAIWNQSNTRRQRPQELWCRMESWKSCETLGDRLRWTREERLGLGSTHKVQAFLEALPPRLRPSSSSYSAVARYEKGERIVPVDYLTAFATKAGISYEWLVTGSGGPDDLPNRRSELRLQAIGKIVGGSLSDAELERFLDSGQAAPELPSAANRTDDPAGRTDHALFAHLADIVTTPKIIAICPENPLAAAIAWMEDRVAKPDAYYSDEALSQWRSFVEDAVEQGLYDPDHEFALPKTAPRSARQRKNVG